MMVNPHGLVFLRSERARANDPTSTRYQYLCVCGKVGWTHRGSWHKQKSCGCRNKALLSAAFTVHGHSKRGKSGRSGSGSPTYSVWKAMRARCRNSRTTSFKDYGGRGITVCDRWHRFENFLADMGKRPEGHQIDRINNDGNYEPGNCRWTSRKEQNRNKRNTLFFTVGGETKSLSEWAERIGMTRDALTQRLKNGWSVEAAMLTPKHPSRGWAKPSRQESL